MKIWEITSREIPFLTEHTGSVDAVAVSLDGKLITAIDKTIKVRNRETGVELFTSRGHTEGVLALAFLPDNKTLLSVTTTATSASGDVTTGKETCSSPARSMPSSAF
ncbi:MAG: hypothetical protein U0793_28745 [Gemmataceae bacterium]